MREIAPSRLRVFASRLEYTTMPAMLSNDFSYTLDADDILNLFRADDLVESHGDDGRARSTHAPRGARAPPRRSGDDEDDCDDFFVHESSIGKTRCDGKDLYLVMEPEDVTSNAKVTNRCAVDSCAPSPSPARVAAPLVEAIECTGDKFSNGAVAYITLSDDGATQHVERSDARWAYTGSTATSPTSRSTSSTSSMKHGLGPSPKRKRTQPARVGEFNNKGFVYSEEHARFVVEYARDHGHCWYQCHKAFCETFDLPTNKFSPTSVRALWQRQLRKHAAE